MQSVEDVITSSDHVITISHEEVETITKSVTMHKHYKIHLKNACVNIRTTGHLQ